MYLMLAIVFFSLIWHGHLYFHAETSIWQGMPFASTFRDQHMVVWGSKG